MGAGLVAGAMLGLATGFFLNSRKGRELTKDAQKRAMQLQKEVVKRLQKAGDLTQDKYEEVIDYVLEYYTKSKDIATKEVPQVKKYLMSQWKTIEKELKPKARTSKKK